MRSALTEYGRQVRHGMIDNDLTLDQLAVLVTERCGMYCDKALLSKLISGQINPCGRPKLVQAINDCLGIVAQ